MTKELITAPTIAEAPPAPIINAEGEKIKADLLTLSGDIREIVATPVRDRAIDVASVIKGHLTAIEKTRKEIKEPFLRMGQAIDDCAKRHVAELATELSRLNGLVGAYNEQQRREAAEALRKQQEEADRIARAAEEERKRQLAEETKRRLAEERAAAKGKELTDAQKQKQLEAQLAEQDRLDALEAERARIEQERIATAERLQAEKATGGAQRYDLKFSIPSLRNLYAALPGCVRMEADLVQLKYVVNNMPEQAKRLTEAGVTWTKTPVFSARGR